MKQRFSYNWNRGYFGTTSAQNVKIGQHIYVIKWLVLVSYATVSNPLHISYVQLNRVLIFVRPNLLSYKVGFTISQSSSNYRIFFTLFKQFLTWKVSRCTITLDTTSSLCEHRMYLYCKSNIFKDLVAKISPLWSRFNWYSPREHVWLTGYTLRYCR